MARIRTIKPEFWTNEKVMSCGAVTRLLFIGMWNFADDYGRMEFAPMSIKARVFPNDNFSACDIRDMLNEMCSNKLLLIYSVTGKEYIEIIGWDHQKIDKRQVSKIPGPFDVGSTVKDGNPPTSADFRRLPPTSAPVMEGKVMEWKVGSEANASGADAPPDPAIPEREYFERGRKVLGKGAGAMIANLLKAKGKNVALARAALEQASQKDNPLEYVAAICRGPPAGKPLTEHQRAQQETKDILNELGNFARGGSGSSQANPGLLPDHSGERPEGFRCGPGETIIDVPRSGYRASG